MIGSFALSFLNIHLKSYAKWKKKHSWSWAFAVIVLLRYKTAAFWSQITLYRSQITHIQTQMSNFEMFVYFLVWNTYTADIELFKYYK